MPVLSSDDIHDRLREHAGWVFRSDALHKQFELPSFVEVIKLVNEVAGLAEEVDHHPDITINYRRVTFVLSTHDQGGVTERDALLMEAIETVAASYLPDGC